MENAQIILENHEQRIKTLERDVSDLKAVHSEIRTMNETLVVLTNELKHTNEHLDRHEEKLNDIENRPKVRMQQILTAVMSAVCGGIVSILIGMLV